MEKNWIEGKSNDIGMIIYGYKSQLIVTSSSGTYKMAMKEVWKFIGRDFFLCQRLVVKWDFENLE